MGTDEKKAKEAPATEALPEKAAEKPAEKAGPKMAVEFWAEKHGMLPEVHPGGELAIPRPRAGERFVRVSMARSGEVAPRHNEKHIHFKAARIMHRWPVGAEMTEAEFLAACEKAYGPKSEVVCR